MENVHVSHSQGSGFVAVNCFPSIILMNSKFDHNCKIVQSQGYKECGNVIIVYEAVNKGGTTVEVFRTNFFNCNGSGGFSGG